MKREIVLTVSESKRLIAKGIAALPEVMQALKTGIIVVATGTSSGGGEIFRGVRIWW